MLVCSRLTSSSGTRLHNALVFHNSGCIVTKAMQEPMPTVAVKFGGMVKSKCHRVLSTGVVPGSPACLSGWFLVLVRPPSHLALALSFPSVHDLADIKRRDTNQYQIATAGSRHVCFWALDPMTGSLASTKVSVLTLETACAPR